MQRASGTFSEEDRARIRDAVGEAERTTAGEIVTVLASASGDYDRAEDLVGLWLAGIGLVLLWWLGLSAAAPGDWGSHTAAVGWPQLLLALAVGLGCFLLGAGVATQITWLRRLFTSRAQMRLQVERTAARAFFEHGLRQTHARTGILIYVSLFERMVRVTGDRAIAEKLGDHEWQGVCERILAGLKRDRPADGMIAAIRRCGEILSVHFPAEPGDRDELPNDLRIVD